MEKTSPTWTKVLLFAGTTIAYFIGSGFATAQEIMQFFTAHGRQFGFVIAISMSIFFYAVWNYIRIGASHELERGNQIFHHICGKLFGTIYNLIATIYCYLVFIVMCGGASSILTQQLGAPPFLGALILGVAVISVVLTGVQGIVRIMGKIGPLIILLIFFIGIFTLVRDGSQIAAGIALVDQGQVEVMAVGKHFWQAAIAYPGGIMIGFAIFMTELGIQNDGKLVLKGLSLGSIGILAALVIMNLALFSNITEVANSNVPSIALAAKISPTLATIFSVVVYIGTCNTSLPLLWTTASRFAKEKTPAFRVMVILLGGMAVIISCLFSYPALVNTIYGYCGYAGVFLLLFIVAFRVRKRLQRKKLAAANAAADVADSATITTSED